MFDKLTGPEAMDFIDKVAEPFKSLPHLPKNIVEFFVKVAPWFALLGAVLSLISGPVVGILGSLGSIFSLDPALLIWTIFVLITSLLTAALLFMAFTPLKARQTKGWVYLYWSEVLGIVSGVVSIFWSRSSFVSTIISILIGLYILFEMKPFYNGAVDGEVVKRSRK